MVWVQTIEEVNKIDQEMFFEKTFNWQFLRGAWAQLVTEGGTGAVKTNFEISMHVDHPPKAESAKSTNAAKFFPSFVINIFFGQFIQWDGWRWQRICNRCTVH